MHAVALSSCTAAVTLVGGSPMMITSCTHTLWLSDSACRSDDTTVTRRAGGLSLSTLIDPVYAALMTLSHVFRSKTWVGPDRAHHEPGMQLIAIAGTGDHHVHRAQLEIQRKWCSMARFKTYPSLQCILDAYR